jgi:hypothetical protein
MPLFEEENQTKNNELNQSVTEVKKESNFITAIGSLLPFAPLVFEQFTGQKIPAMSGTMADISLSLQQIQLSLQTLANNQQQLAQRLIALETNANNHLSNLTNQFNSLRLTHTKEQKRIEYGNNSSRFEEEPENY